MVKRFLVKAPMLARRRYSVAGFRRGGSVALRAERPGRGSYDYFHLVSQLASPGRVGREVFPARIDLHRFKRGRIVAVEIHVDPEGAGQCGHGVAHGSNSIAAGWVPTWWAPMVGGVEGVMLQP
jgi:hypothetical protein